MGGSHSSQLSESVAATAGTEAAGDATANGGISCRSRDLLQQTRCINLERVVDDRVLVTAAAAAADRTPTRPHFNRSTGAVQGARTGSGLNRLAGPGCNQARLRRAILSNREMQRRFLVMRSCRLPVPVLSLRTAVQCFTDHSVDARSSPHPSALFRPCLRPSERIPTRPGPSSQNRLQAPLEEVLTERNGPGRARTVANRAGTALTGAVRTGFQRTFLSVSAGRPDPVSALRPIVGNGTVNYGPPVTASYRLCCAPIRSCYSSYGERGAV